MTHKPMDPEGLVNHVSLFVARMRDAPVSRLRIAVSSEEYMALREFFFAQHGKFFGRIANVPLVIDPTPDEPPLTVELKP